MAKKLKIIPYFRENYLAMIKNSIGTKMFQNAFAKVNLKKKDLTRGGQESCAYFVSTILLIFGLAKELHVTVNGTIRDMEENRWHQIKKPKIGAVILWEPKEFIGSWYAKNRHLGFYVGNNKAISNRREHRVIVIHHWTYNQNRKVQAIYWHKKLDKK